MIKFYYSTAPNPMKVALCLEEMGLSYELTDEYAANNGFTRLVDITIKRSTLHAPKDKAQRYELEPIWNISRPLSYPGRLVEIDFSFAGLRRRLGTRQGPIAWAMVGCHTLSALRRRRSERPSQSHYKRHSANPRYAAFFRLPWGSMTNFLAAPLSKSL